MKVQNDVEMFTKIMMVCGTDKKITTPSYAEFIELLVHIFDLHTAGKANTRPKEMTEARSMYKRQLAHHEALTQLFSVLDVKEEDRGFLRTCFLKIENMLSCMKSVTICSPQAAVLGQGTFLKLVALPQLLEVLRFFFNEGRIGFAFEMMRYLVLMVQKGGGKSDCLQLLRKDLSGQLKDHACADFRIELGKLDVRSFPKMKSIEKMLGSLRSDLSKSIKDEAGVERIVARAKFRFLGAKAAFKALKLLKGHGVNGALLISEGLMMLHRELCERYVCNKEVSELDYDFIGNENFERIGNIFLKAIGHTEYEDLPAEVANSPSLLIQYENHAFLPWCVYKKLVWDLDKGRVDEAYLKHFEKAFLSTVKTHQYGQIAIDVATVLLAMKIKTVASFPHQCLEPLTMVLMENCPISNEIFLAWEIPFGVEMPELVYTSHFNVAQAVYAFNEYVQSGVIKETLCNPLEGLDLILHHVFDEVDRRVFFDKEFTLPASSKFKRPVKILDLDLYDALKSINRLLDQFGLVESVQDNCSMICVSTSHAGDYINKYLALEPAEKREILERIDQEKYRVDLEKMKKGQYSLMEEAV
ncbi:hypothetical protein [Microvirgula aerodenitrificans]|uniref:hypothetical protein n=1 Tax=Microvirgula aerodenitrificans TaxID=57480 RepID=UPI002F40F288